MTMLFLRALLLLAAATPLLAADNTAQPAMVPVAVPAFLDVVSFECRVDSENHKVVVTSGPNLLRVDEESDGYSVIYNPQTDFYTGLEHGNYTYWNFSWPEVRASVENSKRNETRLQDLSSDGLNSDMTSASTSPSTNAADTSASTTGVDDPNSGYVWRATAEKKRIADLDCVRWTGESLGGQNVDAWCYAGVLPKIQTAVNALRTIDEPMALVPVRTIAPDFIFPVYDALTKGGVTPMLITWGDRSDKSSFRFLEAKTRDGKLSLFTVPKLYVKTTLITMDGMNGQPPTERTSGPLPKTWQEAPSK